MRYQQARYSWFNKTENKAYYRKDKELLNNQRMSGQECINVESERTLSKAQLRKDVPLSLILRVTQS